MKAGSADIPWQIRVENLSKTYNREIILKEFSHHFSTGRPTAITGSNGSGKSTLLKLIAGVILPNRGQINFFQNQEVIKEEKVFRHLTFCSPAQELVEEFTLQEMLDFHLKFRSFANGLSKSDFLAKTYFQGHEKKKISLFSSGMKQRLKLGLALFTESGVLLLDEPTTNMDQEGIDWYRKNIINVLNDRLVIVASNQQHEYNYCEDIISMAAYKGH
ncbi:MAG: ATP-binding cassette domain-containing protein [Cyclobacteriaceae bacterium]